MYVLLAGSLDLEGLAELVYNKIKTTRPSVLETSSTSEVLMGIVIREKIRWTLSSCSWGDADGDQDQFRKDAIDTYFPGGTDAPSCMVTGTQKPSCQLESVCTASTAAILRPLQASF